MLRANIIALVLGAATASAHASDVRHLPYFYQYDVAGNGSQHESYVICDNCPPQAPLAIQTKQPRLEIKVSMPSQVVEKPFPIRQPVNLTTVHFDLDSSHIGENEKQSLLIILPSIVPGDAVLVHGYTCDIGTEHHNMALSLKRAAAVASFLKENGVKVSEVRGMGESTLSPSDKALNRRVEIIKQQGGLR